MAKYKITAYLINKDVNNHESDEKSIKDYEYILGLGDHSFKERVDRLKEYPIDGDVFEFDNINSNVFIGEDGDGVYLYEKI